MKSGAHGEIEFVSIDSEIQPWSIVQIIAIVFVGKLRIERVVVCVVDFFINMVDIGSKIVIRFKVFSPPQRLCVRNGHTIGWACGYLTISLILLLNGRTVVEVSCRCRVKGSFRVVVLIIESEIS